jgi:hypothetical protein
MAGLDRMYDAQGFIQNYIEQKIRELLEDPMNEYQDPNWVQAALLFKRAVVPCYGYTMEHLYKLAHDIVDKAEQHGNKWIYQVIPGMYNEKVIDPTSIYMNNLPNGVEVREYKDTVNSIKKWMKDFQENRIDIKIS